jgi:hypothetical protein
MTSTIKHLQAWQDMGRACITAGRQPGGPWSIKAHGMCPILGGFREFMGHGNTFEEAMQALLQSMSSVLMAMKEKGLTE